MAERETRYFHTVLALLVRASILDANGTLGVACPGKRWSSEVLDAQATAAVQAEGAAPPRPRTRPRWPR